MVGHCPCMRMRTALKVISRKLKFGKSHSELVKIHQNHKLDNNFIKKQTDVAQIVFKLCSLERNKVYNKNTLEQ